MWIPAGLVMAASVWMTACGGSGQADPNVPVSLSAMTDEELTAKTRIGVINRIWEIEGSELADRTTIRRQLKRVVWAQGSTWWEIRLAAINALLEDEEGLDDTANMLRLLLPTEPSHEIIAAIGDVSAERGWTEVASGFVRRWSKVEPSIVDEERTERIALEKLYPDRPVEDVVFDVFMDRELLSPSMTDDPTRRARHRYEAWALLRRIDQDGTRTLALLRSTAVDPSDDLVADLRAAATDLGVVPETRSEVEWLRRVRADASVWSRWTTAASGLTSEQRVGLRQRHLPVLAHLRDTGSPLLQTTRSQALDDIASTLAGRKVHTRDRGNSGGSVRDESLRRWGNELVWADAVTILVATSMVEHDGVREALFAQAERDRGDSSTEYGGVLAFDDAGKAVAMSFPPRAVQRRGDRQFVASPDMMLSSDDAPFHYHFHAQEYRNGKYAGPSGGDLTYANEHGRSCLVFTFVSSDAFGVDYYQPGGATIDLGELTRTATQ